MPYTTIVAGNPIQAAWANANVRDQVVTPFASAAARNAAITSPIEGMIAYLQDVNVLTIYNGTSWVATSWKTAEVDTAQTISVGGYVNPGTVGPQVTLETGATALAIVSCWAQSTTLGAFMYMGVVVSGASSVAATDTDAGIVALPFANAATGIHALVPLSGLTPGSNIFTAAYKSSGGTSTVSNRKIAVCGLLG